METLKSPQAFDVEASLNAIGGVSAVQKLELDEQYLAWARQNLSPEVFEAIKNNSWTLDVYRFKYPSDGLSITGYMWTPKNMKAQLPLAVWNRGGSGEFSSIGEVRGGAFVDMPCDLAQMGRIVIASDYRGGVGSEGEDIWGGEDVHDVERVKEISDQLPMCKPGKAVVVGMSRGGMMSYLLAAKNLPWIAGVISLAGGTDLFMSADERPEMQEVFQKHFGGSDDEKAKRSATHFYTDIPKELPLLILHGTADTRVSIEQARKLHELLQRSGHTVEYHELPGAGHNFYGPGTPDREPVLALIQNFLEHIQSDA